jgi:hypothetical protein
VAEAIVTAMDPERTASLCADVRTVPESGEIVFVTQRHLARQRAAGLLLCTVCGRFYGGEKGLRHHQQIAVCGCVHRSIVSFKAAPLIVRCLRIGMKMTGHCRCPRTVAAHTFEKLHSSLPFFLSMATHTPSPRKRLSWQAACKLRFVSHTSPILRAPAVRNRRPSILD